MIMQIELHCYIGMLARLARGICSIFIYNNTIHLLNLLSNWSALDYSIDII